MRHWIFWVALLSPVTAFAVTEPCRLGKLSVSAVSNAVSSFNQKHWAIVDTSKVLKQNGKPDRKLIEALRLGYDDIYQGNAIKPEAGRFLIANLPCSPNIDASPSRIRKLPPEQLAQVNAWALEMLRIAKEATGEDLVVANVSVGRGFSAGDQRGPVIHADDRSTYIHALTSLEGPQTLLFPDGQNIAQHIITDIDGAGVMTLKKIGTDDKAFQSAATPVQPENGKTVMLTGWGFAYGRDGVLPTYHASPRNSGMDRLTLFVNIQPRAK